MSESDAIAALGEDTLGETDSNLLRSYGRPAGAVEVSLGARGLVHGIRRGSTLKAGELPAIHFGDDWTKAQSVLGEPRLSDKYGRHFYSYPQRSLSLSVSTYENRVIGFSLGEWHQKKLRSSKTKRSHPPYK